MTQDREEKDSKGKEIIAAKQAVRDAICDVLQHHEEHVDVITTNPKVTLQYDDASRQHLPDSLVGFINGFYEGRDVGIAEISTGFYNSTSGRSGLYDRPFHIEIKVKPTQPIEDDGPANFLGFIAYPEQQEARADTVTLRQGFSGLSSTIPPMLYITSIYEMGSVREIRQWGSNVSRDEDNDLGFQRINHHMGTNLNPHDYLTFDLGKPRGGLLDPQILFDVVEQYRNLIDAGVTTPKPHLDYTLAQ